MLWFGTYKRSKSETQVLTREAQRLGYYGVDCASLYKNENAIDESCHLVSTKVHWRYQEEKSIRDCIAQSKKLLKQKIHILFLHRPYCTKEKTLCAWRILCEEKENKQTNFIGVCNFQIFQLEWLKESKCLPDVHQFEYHPLVPSQQKVFSWCVENKIQIQIHSLLCFAKSIYTANELIHWFRNEQKRFGVLGSVRADLILGTSSLKHLQDNLITWQSANITPITTVCFEESSPYQSRFVFFRAVS